VIVQSGLIDDNLITVLVVKIIYEIRNFYIQHFAVQYHLLQETGLAKENMFNNSSGI